MSDTSGTLIGALASPDFTIAPPRIDNRPLIPPEVLRVCEPIWNHGRFAGLSVEFRAFDEAIIAAEGLVFTAAGALVEASRTQHSDAEIARARAAIADAGAHMPRLAGIHVLCKKRGVGNYGHWLMEMFPRAVLARRHLTGAELRFVVPEAPGRLGAVIAASLGRIGIEGPMLVACDDAPVRVARLVTVDGLTAHGGYMSPLAVAAVQCLADGIAPGPDPALYVTRTSVGHRRFAEEAAVLARAEAAGFLPFDPGAAELAAQIAAFAGARRIVGVMGAALTNIVFAPPGAELVLFVPANMPDNFFWFIAGLRGLRYREIRCDLAGPVAGPAPWDCDLMIPEQLAAEIFPPLAALMPRRIAPSLPSRRIVSLAEVAAGGECVRNGRRRAEPMPWLPAATIDLPPFAFGDMVSPELASEAAGGRLACPAVPGYLLREVVVHGRHGLLMLDGRLAAESLPSGGAEPDRPAPPPTGTLTAACYLLADEAAQYDDWLLRVLGRFSEAGFAALGATPEAPGGPVLLVSPLDLFWKWEMLNALVPARIPRLTVAAEAVLFIQRLLFRADPATGGVPHPALLDNFARLRAAVLAAPTARPWRRLWVATDGAADTTFAGAAAEAGFTRIVPDAMPVAEQIRAFAEASHILAPHGPALANIGVCQPGAALCEMHPGAPPDWRFRRLAAHCGLRYGCLIGSDADVAAVLRDPRFIAR